MKRLGLLACFAACAFGAIDGTVMNRTTGKPQGGATVTLYRLGQQLGMESIESVKSDAAGKFRIAQDVEGPRLIQTAFDGVTYSHMLSAGAPTSGITLEVFNASSKPGLAKLVSHFLIFQPAGDEMTVTEGFIFQNDGNVSYHDPAGGTLKFVLPAAAQGKVKVQATAPQGMPVERAAEKTARPGVYKVDFPIKPGETRFELNYTVPYAAPATFEGKVLYPGASTSLVAPQGIEIKGDGLTLRGREPRSQASVYEVKAAGFTVQVSGTLSPAESGDSGGEPAIAEVLPRLHQNLSWLLVLAFAILALGFVLLYRARPAEAASPLNPGPRKGAHERRRR